MEPQRKTALSFCLRRTGCPSRWIVLLGGIIAASVTFAAPKMPAPLPGAELFADGAVCHLQLEISAEGLRSLRNDSRNYVRATIREGATVYPNMGIRLKGRSGSFRSVDDKPAITVSSDYFQAEQRFHQLRKIHLNNSVEDGSYLNEKLGSELFAAAGVPSPRVGHALVTLNGRRLGLYVLKEGFTEEFLARHFLRPEGNLYEGETGVTPSLMERLQRSWGTNTASDLKLKQLAEAAREPKAPLRWQRLTNVLDHDRFLSFMAMEILSGHRDGYCLARNNFRLYYDPATEKFTFLPGGMDQLFAPLPVQAHMAGGIAKAMMETSEGQDGYRQRLATLFTNAFHAPTLTNRARALRAGLLPSLTRSEARAFRREVDALCVRLQQRSDDVTRELAMPIPTLLVFEDGLASLRDWHPFDPAGDGRLEKTWGSDRRWLLLIRAGPRTASSWRTKVQLAPGRYRYEAKVRTDGVRPLPFGRKQGASIHVSGLGATGARWLTASTDWIELRAEFEVADRIREVELVCALRASQGDAWFDLGSLRLVRLAP